MLLSSAYRANRSLRRSSSRSNSSSTMLLSRGDKGPPCGVPSSTGLTSPPSITPACRTSAFDGYGLRGHMPARPALYASDPVFVHRLASLLRASFRLHLTVMPLRFAITSRPSRCEEDLHLLADKHARHT